MPTLRFRLTGSTEAANAMVTTLSGLDHVDRVEEVIDQMSGMRDDSSSLQLSDDDTNGVHAIELHAPHVRDVECAQVVAEQRARELGVAVEITEDF
jgi:hypothetical protein